MNKPAVTSFALKIMAIGGMTCNHVANIFAAQLPEWLTVVLCSLGGLTFPIMAFLLVEGYRHTHDVRRYAGRLAAFAVVAQIPYSLLWGATANVLVTLLLGLGMLWADDHFRSRTWFGILTALIVLASSWCDWGCIGPLMILLFQKLRDQGRCRQVGVTLGIAALALGLPATGGILQALAAAGDTAPALAGEMAGATVMAAGALVGNAGALGYATVGLGLAGALLICYNGQRGRPLKWFFYLYYPAHLMALWALAQML